MHIIYRKYVCEALKWDYMQLYFHALNLLRDFPFLY